MLQRIEAGHESQTTCIHQLFQLQSGSAVENSKMSWRQFWLLQCLPLNLGRPVRLSSGSPSFWLWRPEEYMVVVLFDCPRLRWLKLQV